MNSAEEVINIKVVELTYIYNFYFDHLFISQSDSNIVMGEGTTSSASTKW